MEPLGWRPDENDNDGKKKIRYLRGYSPSFPTPRSATATASSSRRQWSTSSAPSTASIPSDPTHASCIRRRCSAPTSPPTSSIPTTRNHALLRGLLISTTRGIRRRRSSIAPSTSRPILCRPPQHIDGHLLQFSVALRLLSQPRLPFGFTPPCGSPLDVIQIRSSPQPQHAARRLRLHNQRRTTEDRHTDWQVSNTVCLRVRRRPEVP